MNCPECGSTQIKGTEELHCASCGLVIEEIISSDHYRPGTSAAPPTPVDGRIIKGHWLYNSHEKRVQKAAQDLNLIGSQLQLPDGSHPQILHLFKQAAYKGLCLGRDSVTLLRACIYRVCLQRRIPKTVAELATSTKEKRDLIRAFNALVKELNLEYESIDPTDLLERHMLNLGLSPITFTHAHQLLEKIKQTKLYSGKNPNSLVAAVIYIAARVNGEPVPQRLIADETDVIETTIRKRYKEIIRFV